MSAWKLSGKCFPQNTSGMNIYRIAECFKDEADKEFVFQSLQYEGLNRNGTDQDCAQSIEYLSAWLHRAYGKAPYILLDEYDTAPCIRPMWITTTTR